MQINSTIQAIAGAYSLNTTSSARRSYASPQVTAEAKDELHISKEAKSFSSMLRELRDMDDVREDKVAAYSAAIANGTYNVPSRDIAAKMLSAFRF
ncbi:MAG: flagellar biosynthesis anti-sigma factor FlgM [Selenomonadaceae bacterium]|nr:flagellar biosynthesis anti-sigma factor FlgM [Selenomonadaceae bacterium]